MPGNSKAKARPAATARSTDPMLNISGDPTKLRGHGNTTKLLNGDARNADLSTTRIPAASAATCVVRSQAALSCSIACLNSCITLHGSKKRLFVKAAIHSFSISRTEGHHVMQRIESAAIARQVRTQFQ